MFQFDGKYQPLYKSYLSIFRYLSFSRYSHLKIRNLENVGQSRDIRSDAIR